MRAVVVYESMYGNTRLIAEAIRVGIGDGTAVVSVRDVTPELFEGTDLLVVGGPTHVRGMSRPSTRRGAAEAAIKPDSQLRLEPGSDGAGLREWFASLGKLFCRAAAFDTRIKMPALISGRASPRIARLLRARAELAAKPESFLFSKQSALLDGEESRGQAWGEHLGAMVRHT
jgi:hypothetical protein